jgi:ABC-type polysaccharide/polyol phosphate export permease
MLTLRDITIKYKQSILGILWALLMPAVIVLAGIIVKLAFATVSGKPLAANELAGVAVKAVPWAFVVASIRFSTNSLVGNANLVTKVYFPRMVLPLAAVMSQLFDFLVASCVLVVFLTILGIPSSMLILWVPVLLGILVGLVSGLALLLSAASLFFRDVKYIVEIVLMFAIFFTPVFYEVSMFGEWGTVLLLNPVAPILEGLRSAIVEQRQPDLLWVGYSALVATLMMTVGVAFFTKVEPAFAECV